MHVSRTDTNHVFTPLDLRKFRVLKSSWQGHFRQGDFVPGKGDEPAVRHEDLEEGGDHQKGRGGAHDDGEARAPEDGPPVPLDTEVLVHNCGQAVPCHRVCQRWRTLLPLGPGATVFRRPDKILWGGNRLRNRLPTQEGYHLPRPKSTVILALLRMKYWLFLISNYWLIHV